MPEILQLLLSSPSSIVLIIVGGLLFAASASRVFFGMELTEEARPAVRLVGLFSLCCGIGLYVVGVVLGPNKILTFNFNPGGYCGSLNDQTYLVQGLDSSNLIMVALNIIELNRERPEEIISGDLRFTIEEVRQANPINREARIRVRWRATGNEQPVRLIFALTLRNRPLFSTLTLIPNSNPLQCGS